MSGKQSEVTCYTLAMSHLSACPNSALLHVLMALNNSIHQKKRNIIEILKTLEDGSPGRACAGSSCPLPANVFTSHSHRSHSPRRRVNQTAKTQSLQRVQAAKSTRFVDYSHIFCYFIHHQRAHRLCSFDAIWWPAMAPRVRALGVRD